MNRVRMLSIMTNVPDIVCEYQYKKMHVACMFVDLIDWNLLYRVIE